MGAYDQRIAAEYADNAALQADFVASFWNELAANARVASGGCLFEWTDKWWKSGSPTTHNADGWENAAFRDRWADEEWWRHCAKSQSFRQATPSHECRGAALDLP